jgi:eukaryotic-like serine/threonine-protein kinase
MTLASGSRLGAYEVLALVGAGGMGEVYRARDTRLNRTVAIKILAPSIAADPQRRERFEREARAISSLTHPHICALYDIGEEPNREPSELESPTIRYLVLEYLEGETLAKRLWEGPLPLAEALRHAIAICGALDKAHRAGIVHRDLKPANVMLTKAGAKLLDFGLARNVAPAIAADTESLLPTTLANLTVEGTILGTLHYMAPEQMEGLPADTRTDIFAFGALLFEMLTGRKAFEGKTHASLLSAILKDEAPAVSHMRPGTPAALDRIVGTCLAKDPDDRYQSARDLLRDVTWVASGSGDAAAAQPISPPARSNRIAWLVAAMTSIALIATVGILLRRSEDKMTPAGPAQFTIVPPDNTSFGGPARGGSGSATQVAISPDGRNIVFVAGTPVAYRIWLRPVGTLEAKPIAGTEGGTFPFWSPDSQSIGFFAAGKLKRVAIAGGTPIVLCDAPGGLGGSWSRDNVILASLSYSSGLARVSGAGGATAIVTTFDPATEERHRWPHFLPDGRHFLYTASTGTCCPALKPASIRIGSLTPGEPEVNLFQTESSVSYGSGHLVFVRDQTLMAQPFDPDTRRLKGDAFPMAEYISTEGSRYASASVSENGTLIYAQDSLQTARQLTWFSRAGRVLDTLGDAAPYSSLALSPDERRVAVALRTGAGENLDIETIDVARGGRSRLILDPEIDRSPVWSPDGARIAFEGRRSGQFSLLEKPINGAAGGETILQRRAAAAGAITPTSWSGDGRFIAYSLGAGFPQRLDVWVLPLFGDRKPFPLVHSPEFLEGSGVFSPDGRWVAYVTNESGRPNISVQPFPGPGARIPISRDGGSQPLWRGNGKELFYLRADGTMMAVPVDATSQFVAGESKALFPMGFGAREK